VRSDAAASSFAAMTSAVLPSAPSSLDAPRPLTTYRGCCHCQSTIFRVTLPSLSSTSAANLRCACAPCAKRGALWARAPPGALVFERGRDALRAYSADDPEAGTDGETQYVRVQRAGMCGHVLSGIWAVLRDVRNARPRRAVRGRPRSARKRTSSAPPGNIYSYEACSDPRDPRHRRRRAADDALRSACHCARVAACAGPPLRARH
jgi:hypothetical protein